MTTKAKMKNANGDGCITEYYTPRGEKRYRALVSIKGEYTSKGTQKRKSFSSTSLSELKKQMKEYQAKMTLNLLPKDSTFTVEQWFHTWLFEFRINDLKKSSFERYEGIFRNYIKGNNLGKKKLIDLRGHDLQAYYNKLIQQNVSVHTIKTLNKALNTCLNAAVKQDYITKNYCKAVTLPSSTPHTTRDAFTLAEQKIFLQHAENHPHETLFCLALSTGMRQGELLALTWNDIDFTNNRIIVSKSYKKVLSFGPNQERKWIDTIQSPKTLSSNRTIYVPDNVMTKLIKHRNRQESIKTQSSSLYQDNNLVFCTNLGLYIDARNLLRSYKRLLHNCSIDYKPFHCLRHTYATRLFESDVPVKTVQTLLGHKDINTTLNIYTHVMPEQMIDAADVLNNIF